ncbi:MAG: hypothetical protein JO075_05855, partial [Acidimicrobiia bacterium]|nr:hypothetical protein [Acidimicrobiia bacterium]
MCGIIAVLSRPSTRPAPEPAWLTERMATAAGLVPAPAEREGPAGDGISANLVAAAAALSEIDAALRGVPGVRTLVEHPGVVDAIRAALTTVDNGIAALERWADSGTCHLAAAE